MVLFGKLGSGAQWPLTKPAIFAFISVSALEIVLLWPCGTGAFPVPPQDVKSLLDQARTDEKAEDYGGAERVYRQALALAPGDPEVLKRLGILCQTELKFTESIELFRRALAASPGYPAVNFFTGVSYLGFNQFPMAADSFQA